MEHLDVVIVGAGMAGASLAWQLAGKRRVLLIERESQPGYHSTGRSAATLHRAYGNAVIRALTAASAFMAPNSLHPGSCYTSPPTPVKQFPERFTSLISVPAMPLPSWLPGKSSPV